MKCSYRLLILVTVLVAQPPASAQQEGHEMSMHNRHQAGGGTAMPVQEAVTDRRQLVHYPEAMKAHTLMNMRDHLLTLQKIQHYLSRGEFDPAAEIAEQRLGMSAMKLHGASEAAEFMPAGMQAAGGAMHRAASRFARAASDASVTGELPPVLSALADLTARCVACHDGYRLQ